MTIVKCHTGGQNVQDCTFRSKQTVQVWQGRHFHQGGEDWYIYACVMLYLISYSLLFKSFKASSTHLKLWSSSAPFPWYAKVIEISPVTTLQAVSEPGFLSSHSGDAEIEGIFALPEETPIGLQGHDLTPQSRHKVTQWPDDLDSTQSSSSHTLSKAVTCTQTPQVIAV